jgi:hypothetical protein
VKTNPQRVLNVLLAVLIFLPGAYLLFNGLWSLEPLPQPPVRTHEVDV